jgi:hypothetical protein
MKLPLLLTTLLAFSGLFKKALPQLEDLVTLSTWITGSFSSQQYAAAGTSYYDILLQRSPIWTDLPPSPAPPRWE